jgi:Anaerobic dehydrogenases, typically selenocysteine-containing
MKLTRREFLRRGGALAGMWTGLSQLGEPVLAFLRTRGARWPWYRPDEVRITYNYCDMCMWRCGMLVYTVNGRVVKVEGNPKDPKSRGRLCGRGQAAVAHLYDPDRLRKPLIRTGERGTWSFREASWEEALDRAAEALARLRDQYGPESVAWFAHTTGDFWFGDYLPLAFGSPNVGKPATGLCLTPREVAAQLTFGRGVGGHEPVDWENTRYIVLIGNHIGENAHNTVMQDFARALAQGAKLVVVDPRYSTAAMKAHRWLPIKPGTDTALLLAWMNVLITEGLYDREYIEKYTVGFERLAEHIRPFTPEWAAPITEIPAEVIREVAREMAAHRPQVVIPPGRHVVWYGNDTQRMRALFILNVLLGNVGRRGGLYLPRAPALDPYPHPPFPVEVAAGGCGAAAVGIRIPDTPGHPPRADGVGSKFATGPVVIQELIEPMITGQPYPIRGLVVYGVNLFHSIPNVPRTIEALKRLEFVLAIDVLPQEHLAWADIVLPEATFLERYDELWVASHRIPYIALREPAVEPLPDTRPGWWIARELGLRLGLADYFQWSSIEEYLNTRLMSVGLSLDRLREAGGVFTWPGKPYLEDYGEGETPFPTPSGKIEIYSEALARAGFDPLPVYEPVEEPPPGYFRLLYGRHPLHTFGKTQNNPWLAEVYPENEVWVNDEAAAALGLKNGDLVLLENQDGVRSGPVRVRATPRIRKDAVYLVHGFGHRGSRLSRAEGRGASDNLLITRYRLDPISGGAGMRVNFVRLIQEV